MPEKPTYDMLERRIQELERAETERLKALRALQDSETRFRLLFEKSPVAYQSLDRRGHLIAVNKAWLDTLGYRKEEVLGKSFGDFLHPEWINHFKQNFPRFKAVGEILGVEFEMIKKDGSTIMVSFNGRIGKDSDGAFLQTHCMLSDITEKHQADQRLRNQKNFLNAVIDSLAETVYIFEAETGTGVRWNKALEAVSGYDFETVKHRPPARFFSEPEQARFAALLERIRREGHASAELHYVTADGRQMPFNYSFVSVKGPEGQNWICAIGRDITERKQADDRLRENERMLAEAQSLAHVGSWEWDIETGKVNWSTEVYRIFGLEPRLFEPQIDSIMTRFHPDDRNKHEELIEQALADRKTYSFDARILLPDQTVREVLSTSRGRYDDEGQLYSIIGAVFDVTERKKIQRALQKSEAQHRLILESMVDPLYICSPGFKITFMNPAMQDRLGRDATGEICHQAIHGSEVRCQSCVMDTVIAGKTIERNVVSAFDSRTYRTTDMPINNEDGTVSKMTLLRDITDYLEAVAENEKTQARLAQAQKMESIGNLAGGIAHDFNNILSAIIGYTELALYDVPPESKLEDRLREVLAAGERAGNLVRQILAFARQSDADVRPISVYAIVKEVLGFIRSSLPTTIEIRQNLQSQALIMGNQTQVHQIVMNLCTNAMHAMEKDGGRLEVELTDVSREDLNHREALRLRGRKYLCIKIADSGEGIDPDILGTIFEPYVTTKGPGEGTGMGLAVVNGIVESYGGAITVESTPGKGAVFAVYLPIITKGRVSDRPEPEVIPRGTERVLFVDDEAALARLGGEILKELGYQATTRTSSVEALRLFQAKPDDFDLVVSDMTMPNLTGDKLCAEIHKIRPEVPVILCTGYSKWINAESARELEIKAFVHKPIVRSAFAETVRKALDESQGAEDA